MRGTTVIGFLAGLVVGSVLTYHGLKNKVEAEIDEEVNKVKEFYKDQLEKQQAEYFEKEEYLKSKAAVAEDKGSIVSKIINQKKIENYESGQDEENDIDSDEAPAGAFEVFRDDIIAQDKPFVIEEDMVGEYISYDLISLIYFSDGVLTDDWEVPVENPDETVGKEYEGYFETGEDVVYVRNDKLKCEFEITRDLRTFEEVKEEGSER
jgi:hypothetical protein|nr:MAG TPA: YtxH-like protein [Caudoviricetes sp.]